MTCDSSNTAPAMPSKRKPRTTPLLSNRSDEVETQLPSADAMDMDEDTTSTIADENEEEKLCMVVNGGETTAPVSNVRSTSNKVKREIFGDIDEDSKQETLKKIRKMMENEEIKPSISQPSTPKKVRDKNNSNSNNNAAASSSKDVIKTPTKKEPTSSPSTPGREQAPLANAWQQDHWNDLNFAILKASELYDASPSLTPWRIKGRLHVKLRQLMSQANGGEAASKRWDVEQKPVRSKGNSPKKLQQQQQQQQQ
ncbi:uncharacterized protein UTRI_01481 [Ustilago trichophora]|uniref:Uncharacterized protein n=1 Tax=Ustilago trichophora TaxID=86804 RepID=A0A5C3DWI1_9BASI|nr:uncharacterized protein UTRI_01481 [Ustilago trichophora]